MARDEIDWFLEQVRETWKYIVLVLPMGMEREKLVMGKNGYSYQLGRPSLILCFASEDPGIKTWIWLIASQGYRYGKSAG